MQTHAEDALWSFVSSEGKPPSPFSSMSGTERREIDPHRACPACSTKLVTKIVFVHARGLGALIVLPVIFFEWHP